MRDPIKALEMIRAAVNADGADPALNRRAVEAIIAEVLDPPGALFYAARDHDRGPGAWSVMGRGFNLPVDDRTLTHAIACFLSGYDQAAADFRALWRKHRDEEPK